MKKIRSATLNDVPAMLDIYRPYVLETPITFETEAPSVEDFGNRVSEKTKKFPWLVCEESGEVLGYAYAGAFRERAAYAWSAESSVYVRRGHHGRGVGDSLYETLLDLLKRQGVLNVIGGLTLPNEASRRLHERFGFQQVSQYKEAGYKMGRWWDVGYWQLALPKPPAPAALAKPLPLVH